VPWEKQFDVDRALDRAVETFWEKGYNGASMQELLDRMGIHRGSCYATFGGKADLFRRALRRYLDTLEAGVVERSGEGRALDALQALFDGVVEDECARSGGPHGCFLVNASLELDTLPEGVRPLVHEGFRTMERAFARLVRRAQAEGDVPGSVDADGAARALLGLMSGLRVLARTGADRATLRAGADRARALVA